MKTVIKVLRLTLVVIMVAYTAFLLDGTYYKVLKPMLLDIDNWTQAPLFILVYIARFSIGWFIGQNIYNIYIYLFEKKTS